MQSSYPCHCVYNAVFDPEKCILREKNKVFLDQYTLKNNCISGSDPDMIRPRYDPDMNRYEFPTAQFKQMHSKYGVVTLHRPSNVDNKETLEAIFETLSKISETLPLIFPIHPRTRKNMEAFNIKPGANIKLTDPLSYMEFLNLWKDAKLALTDSGGLQEETTALGIPCLTIRENTERPITVSQGTNELMETSREKILDAFDKIMVGEWKTGQKPKFWDGNAAQRIMELICNI